MDRYLAKLIVFTILGVSYRFLGFIMFFGVFSNMILDSESQPISAARKDSTGRSSMLVPPAIGSYRYIRYPRDGNLWSPQQGLMTDDQKAMIQ